MVHDPDAEGFSRLFKAAGHQQVLLAWRGVPGRMVMHQEDGFGGVLDGRPEYLTGMNEAPVERPNGDPVRAYHPVLGVQRRDVEFFLPRVSPLPCQVVTAERKGFVGTGDAVTAALPVGGSLGNPP